MTLRKKYRTSLLIDVAKGHYAKYAEAQLNPVSSESE